MDLKSTRHARDGAYIGPRYWRPSIVLKPTPSKPARETRVTMLDMAAAERLQVSSYHAPFPAAGHILKDGNGYRFIPVQWSPVI